MPKAKKQSRTSALFSLLKPTSPARGMLLFALTFAVIGGSYMAFSSFAATTSVVYSGSQIHNLGDAYTTNVCTGGKGCSLDWVVVPPAGKIYSDFSGVRPGDSGSIWHLVCFTAKKATSQAGKATLSADVSPDLGFNELFPNTFTVGNSFQTYCMSTNSQGISKVYVQAAGSGTYSNIVVSSISVQQSN